jgi:phage terminase large subunit-like protein
MADEIDSISIGQINSLRAHLKKLHTTTEYLQKYCRWNYYKPHPETQLKFHNSPAAERSIVLGNQQGKSTATGFEIAFAACDYWPAWHHGLHPTPPNIERSARFIGWYASISSQTVRDGIQHKLLGDISQKDGLGTGAIPLDYIRGISMSRGIAHFVDTITVARETGGIGLLQSKTYEQSVQSYQGVPVDLALVDEDPGYDDRIYNELLARTISTNGRIIVSLTPMLGMTPIRKRFLAGGSNIFEIRGGLEQALHIPAERRQRIIESVPERERAARIYGLEMQGEGAVFNTPVADIQFDLRPQSFMPWWPCCWSIDFDHGGQSSGAHPFAAVFAIHDPQTDVIYITDAWKLYRQLPETHVARIKSHSYWDAPVLWPHDGTQSGSVETGEHLAGVYRKFGLNLRPTWTTFPQGGFDFAAGVSEMERRFAAGKLKIARHLGEWFVEYQNYHYEKGVVKKVDDDLMSASRGLVMGIRHARAMSGDGYEGGGRRHKGPRMCKGLDDWDVFTGRPL